MKLRIFSYVIIALISLGCNQQKVTRIDPNKTTDLSGKWNDSDARLVAEEMMKDLSTAIWLEEHEKKTGNKPVIIISLIQNRTSEHIDEEMYIKQMERKLLNDRVVRIVQGGEFRQRLRDERADQSKYASEDTQKKWGLELGADYILTGVMTSSTDVNKRETINYYQTNLELTNMETNEKVWIGEKRIKKYIGNR